VVGVTHVSVRLDDEELEEFLAGRESNSETVRTALRYLRAQEKGVNDDRLTDHQQVAYRWLRDRVGVGGSASVGMVENRLSQSLSVDMDLVRSQVLRPLESLDYISVQARVQSARITVLAPPSEDEPGASLEVDSVEEAGDRLDALETAGKEVAESAD
jgi:hypothetical protein